MSDVPPGETNREHGPKRRKAQSADRPPQDQAVRELMDTLVK